MLKRKSEQCVWLLACALWVASASLAQDDLDEFDLDEISIEVPVNTAEEQRSHRIDATLTKACDNPLTAFDIVEALTSPTPFGHPPIQLQNFLQQNQSLYQFTNPPVVRELHDLPTLMPFEYHCAPSWAFSANAFFNQTRKVYFTQNSPYIGCYLNLTVPDLINLIATDEFPADNIPSVLDIVGKNLTLEERRVGAMLDVWKHYKRWIFTAALPVYLVEHNFFLSQATQNKLLELPIFTGGAGLPGLNFDNFTSQHLIRDRAGIGDLRLQVLYDCARCEDQQIQLGGQITFPTAKAAITGVVGGKSKICRPPTINLFELLNLGLCGAPESVGGGGDKESLLDAKELAVGYGIATLDQLAETLCDRSLGQDHVNLGPIIHIQQPVWSHNCFESSFELYGEMKYSIPAHEVRFLKIITPAAAFNRDYTVEADADSNLAFLDEQTTNYLFPAIVNIKTKPGLMFHTTAALNGFWNEWEAGLGYDFWAQLKEKFGRLKCQASGFGSTFDGNAGRKQTAYEGKIFGQAGMRLCGETFAMRFLVRGDATVHHKGIGSSFTASLNFIIDY